MSSNIREEMETIGKQLQTSTGKARIELMLEYVRLQRAKNIEDGRPWPAVAAAAADEEDDDDEDEDADADDDEDDPDEWCSLSGSDDEYSSSSSSEDDYSPPPIPCSTPLRFKVGDEVQCQIGHGYDSSSRCSVDGWVDGVVTQLWYREKHWEPTDIAPYKIKLHDNTNIFSPTDCDDNIRKCQVRVNDERAVLRLARIRLRCALESACSSGDLAVLSSCLDEVDANKSISREDTILTCACVGGHAPLVELLIARGADVNLAASGGLRTTPLIAAIDAFHIGIVELLLCSGASIEMTDKKGSTPLQYSVCSFKKQDDSIVELLLAKGADVHRASRGLSPLMFAIERGLITTTQLFLEKGASPNQTSSSESFNRLRPLHLASHKGFDDIVMLLIDKWGVSPDQKNEDGFTSLHVASLAGQRIVVTLLMLKGASVNCTLPDGVTTPLLMAAESGSEDVVAELLSGGAKPRPNDCAMSEYRAAIAKGHRGCAYKIQAHLCKQAAIAADAAARELLELEDAETAAGKPNMSKSKMRKEKEKEKKAAAAAAAAAAKPLVASVERTLEQPPPPPTATEDPWESFLSAIQNELPTVSSDGGGRAQTSPAPPSASAKAAPSDSTRGTQKKLR